MQAILGFTLLDDETELKAAIQSMDCIAAIHDFRERLRSLAKYCSNYSLASEAVTDFDMLDLYGCLDDPL